MAEATYLKVTLKLMALYAGIFGSLALFFQDTAEFIFSHAIQDPVTAMYWGVSLLILSIFYLFLSMDPRKYRLFLWVGVFDLGGVVILTIYLIVTGAISFIQGAASVILNPIFMIILLFGLAKEPEWEVLMVVGGESQGKEPKHPQSLPNHALGKHPLQNK